MTLEISRFRNFEERSLVPETAQRASFDLPKMVSSRADGSHPRIDQRWGFLRFHFSILESKVVGFTPKSSAAPSGPLIFQFAASSTCTRLSRSRRCSSASVRNLGCASLPVEALGRATGTD